MSINFSKLEKKISLYMQEVHRTPNKIRSKKIPWRYIIVILHKAKNKEKMLNAAREKKVTFIKQWIKKWVSFYQK